MFIATQGINAFNVFYMGTDPNIPKPGKYILQVRKDGIGLAEGFKLRGVVPGNQIKEIKVGYEVQSKGLSAGGAIAGGILAGGVGALAGASMGSKKVEPHVAITYKDNSGREQQVIVVTKQAEKLKKKLDKHYKSVA